jgi:hypothetical protein
MKPILFNVQGRYGDIIAASVIANMLTRQGHTLWWVTLPRYVPVVEAACPKCLCFGIDKWARDDSWGDARTDDLMCEFPDMAVCNAHLGCAENHNAYIASGKHPLVWLKEKAETDLGVTLSDDYAAHLQWNRPRSDAVTMQPYAIVAPEAKTCQSMSDDTTNKLFLMLRKKWYVKLLVPDGKRYKSGLCLSGYSFVDCVDIIRNASHFSGLDSGLAWASLYSDCTKTIYHQKARFDQVHTAFSFIDPKAEDVIQ